MNTPSKIIFHFVKKLLTKTKFLGHLSIFSYCLQIYPWIKQLIFAFIQSSIRRRKLKTCFRNISNNYLHFLLSHLIFLLMMFIINTLMVQQQSLIWVQDWKICFQSTVNIYGQKRVPCSFYLSIVIDMQTTFFSHFKVEVM